MKTRNIITLLFCITFIFAGCSSNIRVTGTVKYPDGEPLSRGNIFFADAGGKLMYNGTIKPDGSFDIGGTADGEGVPPGTYKAWISGANITDYLRDANGNYGSMIQDIIIDTKYDTPETSGLSFEIKRGKKNKIELTVERPKK